MTKTAFLMPPEQPAVWVAAYGSVTVSQIGKEFPNGGMNEAGLVVEQTTLWQSEYPPADHRPAVSELQWIQYMLDTCATVDDVIDKAQTIRIAHDAQSKLHYLIGDKDGRLAVIEFLLGKLHVHQYDTLPVPVMANSPYQHAVRCRLDGESSWEKADDYERNSMKRFMVVADALEQVPFRQTDVIAAAFDVLKAARREDTVFSIVYDPHDMVIHFTTNREVKRKTVKLSDMDFHPDQPAYALNLHLSDSNQLLERFEVYGYELNRKVVEAFFRDPTLTEVFQWNITDEMIHYFAAYPDSAVYKK
jgi:choloylglycine hydrolase